jgi:hypothetical protein
MLAQTSAQEWMLQPIHDVLIPTATVGAVRRAESGQFVSAALFSKKRRFQGSATYVSWLARVKLFEIHD